MRDYRKNSKRDILETNLLPPVVVIVYEEKNSHYLSISASFISSTHPSFQVGVIVNPKTPESNPSIKQTYEGVHPPSKPLSIPLTV